MTKQIEFVVPRAPVRDADRAPAHGPTSERPSVQGTGPLIPVHEIPGLRPEEQRRLIADLGNQRGGDNRANAGDLLKPPAVFT